LEEGGPEHLANWISHYKKRWSHWGGERNHSGISFISIPRKEGEGKEETTRRGGKWIYERHVKRGRGKKGKCAPSSLLNLRKLEGGEDPLRLSKAEGGRDNQVDLFIIQEKKKKRTCISGQLEKTGGGEEKGKSRSAAFKLPRPHPLRREKKGGGETSASL